MPRGGRIFATPFSLLHFSLARWLILFSAYLIVTEVIN
jgi:hypothetical protein